jgi:hypothetical protein
LIEYLAFEIRGTILSIKEKEVRIAGRFSETVAGCRLGWSQAGTLNGSKDICFNVVADFVGSRAANRARFQIRRAVPDDIL